MKHYKNIYLFIALVIIIFSVTDSSAAIRRMIGPNITVSWQSTYLAIESGEIIVQDNPAWENALALGWFFDYLVTPYVSLRTNWFFYPTSMGGNYTDFTEENGKITAHEIGISVLRHFEGHPLNPWFGFGPFVGFTTLDNINSYTIHAILSVGFDYQISDDVFFCPELMGGIGARIISENEEKDVSIDVPTGGDFTSSGIVVFLKIGFGKAF
jgi:hypothetical protein